MAKEFSAFLRAEIGNDATDPTQEPQNRTLGRLAQMRLEFAEGQLDRVEVRRILRKINPLIGLQRDQCAAQVLIGDLQEGQSGTGSDIRVELESATSGGSPLTEGARQAADRDHWRLQLTLLCGAPSSRSLRWVQSRTWCRAVAARPIAASTSAMRCSFNNECLRSCL
jgi:hypothetical protein